MQSETESETNTASPSPPLVTEKQRPFQFNLKAILIAMTIVCILCVPGGHDVISYFYVVCIPTFLSIAIWKGRGWIRPFAICAIVPHVPTVANVLWMLFDQRFPPDFMGAMFYGLIAGLGGAASHRYLARVNGMVPVPNLPFIRNWISNDESF